MKNHIPIWNISEETRKEMDKRYWNVIEKDCNHIPVRPGGNFKSAIEYLIRTITLHFIVLCNKTIIFHVKSLLRKKEIRIKTKINHKNGSSKKIKFFEDYELAKSASNKVGI